MNIICAIAQAFVTIAVIKVETIQFKKMDSIREYLDDFYILLDISYVVIITIHLIFRLIYINGNITTEW